MKEVHVDESDFKSCQDFVAKAVKKDKFDLTKLESRILEVWKVQSNQVILF